LLAESRHGEDDDAEPGDEPEQLRCPLLERQAMLQLRDQLGDRAVDEAARGDHEPVPKELPPRPDDEIADHAADHRSTAREGVEEKRPAA
jgi:hypothetical protein